MLIQQRILAKNVHIHVQHVLIQLNAKYAVRDDTWIQQQIHAFLVVLEHM